MSSDPDDQTSGWGSQEPRWDDAATPAPGSRGWGDDLGAHGATRPAAVGKRVGAYIIDMVLITIALAIVFAIMLSGSGALPASPEGIDQGNALATGLGTSVLTLAYFMLLEAGSGQTLGKRALGIKVVSADGISLPSLTATFKRRVLFVIGNVIPIVGSLITFVVPLAALITAIQDDPDNQGFHDRWAGTRVIDA
jgi:uncharacterized RDD family membrane protein YckC